MDLINTLDTTGEFDAAAKLRPGEPYFMLIGRDSLAPPRVLDWARDNRKRAMDEHSRGLLTDAERDDELRKSTQAEEMAWAMQSYKTGEKEIVTHPESRPSYSGHELPAEAQRRDREQAVRSRAGAVVNNAVGELTEQLELLRDILPGPVHTDLGDLVDALHGLADKVRPPRPLIDDRRTK